MVERRARLLAQEGDRPLVRPGVAVDAGRDERVVDVADGEDPGVELELARVEPARVAAAGEPLVVVEHEPADRVGEAAELAQQLATPLRVALDDGELLVGQRAGLLQDRVGDVELADVVEQRRRSRAGGGGAAGGRAPRRPGRRASPPGGCAPRWRRPSRRGASSARARGAPRNASSSATSSAARRSPESGRDCAERRRSSATWTPTATIPTARAGGRATSPVRPGEQHRRRHGGHQPGQPTTTRGRRDGA